MSIQDYFNREQLQYRKREHILRQVFRFMVVTLTLVKVLFPLIAIYGTVETFVIVFIVFSTTVLIGKTIAFISIFYLMNRYHHYEFKRTKKAMALFFVLSMGLFLLAIMVFI